MSKIAKKRIEPLQPASTKGTQRAAAGIHGCAVAIEMNAIVKLLTIPLAEDRTYVAAVSAGALLLLFIIVPSFTTARTLRAKLTGAAVVLTYGTTVRSFRSFFADVLPVEFQYETSFDAAAKRISSQHDLSIFTNTRQEYSQFQQLWTKMFIKSLAILSWNVIIGLLYYQSTERCDNRNSELSCRNDSAVAIIGNLCMWNRVSQQCGDASQNDILGFVVIVVLAVTLLTSATDKVMSSIAAHATLAVQNRRWGWLYCCFIREKPHPSGLDKRGRITVQGKKVRVMPTPGAGSDLERGGSDTSFEEGWSLRVKPTGRSGVAATRLAALLPEISLPFKNCRLSLGTANAARSVSLAQLLQVEEGALQHYGDEWLSLAVQSRKATMMRAVRLSVMKSTMDYVSAVQERQHMLQHSRERYLWMESADRPLRISNCWDALWRAFRLRQLRWYDFGDPRTALELVHLAHLQHAELIDDRLRRSRARAAALRARLLARPDDAARDLCLMRSFLADSLCGYKRVVASAVLFEPEEAQAARHSRVAFQYLALCLLPAYLVITLGIVFYGGMALKGPTTRVWLVCTVASFLVQYLYLQPAVIWLLGVWVPGTAKKDLLALHWALQVRSRSLLGRRTGLLRSVNALVQHFNPTCRAARLVPHLPVARLLLSLADHDLPPASAVWRRPRRQEVRYASAQVLNTGSPLVADRCEAIGVNLNSAGRFLYNIARTCAMAALRIALHALFLLPQWARQLVVEAVCCANLAGLLLVFHVTNRRDPSGLYTALVTVVVVVCIAVSVYKAYRDELRERTVLSSLARQHQRYGLDCNPPCAKR